MFVISVSAHHFYQVDNMKANLKIPLFGRPLKLK